MALLKGLILSQYQQSCSGGFLWRFVFEAALKTPSVDFRKRLKDTQLEGYRAVVFDLRYITLSSDSNKTLITELIELAHGLNLRLGSRNKCLRLLVSSEQEAEGPQHRFFDLEAHGYVFYTHERQALR